MFHLETKIHILYKNTRIFCCYCFSHFGCKTSEVRKNYCYLDASEFVTGGCCGMLKWRPSANCIFIPKGLELGHLHICSFNSTQANYISWGAEGFVCSNSRRVCKSSCCHSRKPPVPADLVEPAVTSILGR